MSVAFAAPRQRGKGEITPAAIQKVKGEGPGGPGPGAGGCSCFLPPGRAGKGVAAPRSAQAPAGGRGGRAALRCAGGARGTARRGRRRRRAGRCLSALG